MSKRLFSYLAGISFLLMSCSSKTLGVADYIRYTEQNKAARTDSLSTEKMDLILVRTPYDYYLALNAKEGIIEKKEAKRHQQSHEAVSFFGMLVECRSGGLFDQSAWTKAEQMKFYATDFKHYIKAVTKAGDTLSCQNFLFQAGANFGNRSYFEFEIPAHEEELKEVFFSFVPMGSEGLNCPIKEITTTGQPKLKIK